MSGLSITVWVVSLCFSETRAGRATGPEISDLTMAMISVGARTMMTSMMPHTKVFFYECGLIKVL